MIPNPYPGAFFVIDGIDGCGKSTQVSKLYDFLSKLGTTVATKEPNKSAPFGKQLYDDLAGEGASLHKVHPFGFQTWYACNSKENMRQVVIPNLMSGVNVVSDRYRSSMVFGARGPGFRPILKIEALMQMNAQILGEYFIQPDVLIILDVSVETAMARLKEKGRKMDGYETPSVLSETRHNFLLFADMYKNGCYKINGGLEPDLVFEKIKELVLPTISRKKQSAL